MKKVLSFVLVLAMILGSVSMAFAAALPFEDAPNSKLATVLRDLGVLKGSDGKVFLETPVSRAEICAILMRVLGYEDYCTADYAINGASSFSDVAPGTWYNGYVNVAAQLGYVNGIGDGKFNPLGNVGLNDGVAFVMKALGYSADHLLLDWPYNFLVPAQSAGLLKGVDTSSAELTREAMFTILYNALDLSIVKWNKTEEQFKTINVTFAELASKEDGVKTSDYVTDAAFITESTKGVNPALDLSAYVGKYVEVLSKGGIIAVLGETSVAGSDVEYVGTTPTTLGGLKISSAAVLNKYYVNGQEVAVAEYNAMANSPAALAKGYEWAVEARITKNAAGVEVVDGLYSASVEIMSGYALATKAFAASCAAVTAASINGYTVNFSGSAVLTAVRGAASSLDEIKEGDVLELYTLKDGAKLAIIEVVRDDFEAKVTKYTAKEFTFDNGKTYTSNAAAGLGVDADALHQFVSPVSVKLDSNGDIVYATAPGVEAAAPAFTTSYGIVIDIDAEAVYEYTAKGTKITTNNSVSIMPLGEATALSFENVSVAGLTDANGWTVSPIPVANELVEYSVSSEGKLLDMTAGAINSIASQSSTGALLKANKFDNYYISKDVEIIKISTGAAKKAEAYGVYTLAELEGQKIDAQYEVEDDVIVLLVVSKVYSAVADTTKSYVSPAALIDWSVVDANGRKVQYLADGKVQEAYVTNNALANVGTTSNEAIYTFTFLKATGEIFSVVELPAAGDTLTSTGAITVAAVFDGMDKITDDGSSFDFVVSDAVVWALTDDGFILGTEDTLQKNIDKYCAATVELYAVGDIEDAYNFVVIR